MFEPVSLTPVPSTLAECVYRTYGSYGDVPVAVVQSTIARYLGPHPTVPLTGYTYAGKVIAALGSRGVETLSPDQGYIVLLNVGTKKSSEPDLEVAISSIYGSSKSLPVMDFFLRSGIPDPRTVRSTFAVKKINDLVDAVLVADSMSERERKRCYVACQAFGRLSSNRHLIYKLCHE